MFSTLIAGFGLLIFSAISNSYICLLMMDDVTKIHEENNP